MFSPPIPPQNSLPIRRSYRLDDYCFYIDNWQTAVEKDRINGQTDPPPDLAIEIDVTTYSDANNYAVYQVPEVWLLKRN